MNEQREYLLLKNRIDYCNKKAEESVESNPSDALVYAEEALKISDLLSSDKDKMKALENIAWSYYYLDNYDKALEYALYIKIIIDKVNDISKYANILALTGHIYRKTGSFDLALQGYFDAIKFYELIDDKYNIAYIYRSIAIVYTLMHHLERALEYAFKALSDFEELGIERRIATTFLTIGDIYRELRDEKNSILYNSRALELYKKYNDEVGIAYSYINLGDIYFNHNNIKESKEYFDLSLEICSKINNRFGVVHIYHYIAKLSINTSEYIKAEEYMKKGLKLAKNISSKYIIADYYMLYSTYYSKINEYRKALKYYMLYSKVKEVMLSDKYEQMINNIQAEYNLYKKEKELELYKLQEKVLRKANKRLEKANKNFKKQNSILRDMSGRLEKISKLDDLTGLFNRRGLKEIIKHIELSSCENAEYSLVLCDIDGFKSINDKYGHSFGDKVLKKISDTLRKELTQSDYIARWGGEEFLLLLKKGKNETQYEINRIRKVIESMKLRANDNIVKITLTFGISEYSQGNFKKCIIDADYALYYGKNNGKNCVSMISEGIEGLGYLLLRG